MLLVNTNRKPCMRNPTCSMRFEIEWSKSFEWRSLRLWRLVSRNGDDLGNMLLLNISRKPNRGNPNATLDFTIRDQEMSNSRYQRFWAVDLYIVASIWIWMSHKTICVQAGFSSYWLCQQRSWNWNSSVVCCPSVRPWHRLSPNLLHGFLSNFNYCCFPWAIMPGLFRIFEKKNVSGFFANIFGFDSQTLWEPKFQNVTPPSTHFRIFANLSWI